MNQLTKQQLKGEGLLFLAALIWGVSFVFQKTGMDYVGPMTFGLMRFSIGSIAMLPLIFLYDRHTSGKGLQVMPFTDRTLLKAGILTGLTNFGLSSFQQIGLVYTTAGKAGFISVMYVALVPVFMLFLRRKVRRLTWFCIVCAMFGLYLLCMGESFSLSMGDSWMLLCAFLFSLQILSVNYFVKYTDPVKLAALEFLFEGIFAGICMLVFEPLNAEGVMAALPTILYAGFMSSAVGYTLQIVAQDGLDPAVASIVMSFESVFAALAGWVVLHEAMSARELIGCVLMFAAIVISQI